MGRWNYFIFCDDAAWEALEILRQSDDVYASLVGMLDAPDFDSYEACHASIVAATTVDALLHGMYNEILVENPNGLDDFTALIVVNLDLDVVTLQDKAIDSLERILDKSAIKDRWQGEASFNAWSDNLEKLLNRLKA